MAPADKHSFKVIAKISPFAIAIVRMAVITTLIHDPSIVLKNFIIIFPANILSLKNKNHQHPTGWGAGQPGFPCVVGENWVSISL